MQLSPLNPGLHIHYPRISLQIPFSLQLSLQGNENPNPSIKQKTNSFVIFNC
jgi:hypothetical protein